MQFQASQWKGQRRPSLSNNGKPRYRIEERFKVLCGLDERSEHDERISERKCVDFIG